MGLLEGKTAIITGAANGIGLATVRLFAQEGAQVVINDTGGDIDGSGARPDAAATLAAALKGEGYDVVAVSESIAEETGVRALFEAAMDTYGQVNVLINNAGILRDKTLLNLSPADFDQVLDVHLKGSFLCTQAAAKRMKQTGGHIVNTTSISGLLGNFGQTNYSAAKAGVYGLTRTASIELQRYGIRVNAVAPIAKTRLTAKLPMFEHVDSMTPEHVAPVHLFLGSALCGETTGVVLSVAGGRLSVYKVVESPGKFKEDANGIWSAQEIAEHFQSIGRM